MVAYSHSQSKATEEQYKRVWGQFSSFIDKTAEQILAEYNASDERAIKRQYAQYIMAWIVSLSEKGLTPTSIKVMVGAVKSFFKYNSLALGFVPQAMSGVFYHNKDITKEEIIQIMAVAKIREKAFFAVMAQSGLRPHTIRQLKLKHLESFDKMPCKIEVPKEIAKGKYGSYVTFIGSDAIKYLKQYFATRAKLTPEDLVFCSHDDPKKPVNVKDMSRAFRLAARKLEKSGAISFEIREGKPSELRLYNLRKFFRKQAHQVGFENVNYLMGHTVRGSDANYKPQDPEFYRKLYKEKAMPFVRLKTATPTETEKTIVELKKQLAERDKEIEAMKGTIAKIQPLVDFVESFDTPEHLKKALNLITDDHGDERLRPKKTIEEVANEIKRDEAKLEELAREKGLPMTKEDYESRKKRRCKKANSVQKNDPRSCFCIRSRAANGVMIDRHEQRKTC